MKKVDVIKYARGKYFSSSGTPVNEEAEKVINGVYEIRNSIIAASENFDMRKSLLVEVEYSKEMLALYRIIAPDPGAWEVFLTSLTLNGVTARTIQSIRTTVNASYNELLREAELEYVEESTVKIITGIKSFAAENGRDGITLKIITFK